MKTNNKFKKIGAVIAVGLLIGLSFAPVINANCTNNIQGTDAYSGDYYFVDDGLGNNYYIFSNWLIENPSNYLSYNINYLGGNQKVSVIYQGDEIYEDLPLIENKIYNISLHLITEENGNRQLQIYIDNEYYNNIQLGVSLSSNDKIMIGGISGSEYSNIRTCDTLIEPICDINNLGLCTTQEECIAITGAYWINNACTNVCTPNWSVGAWSSCLDGQKTRIVTDLNACGIDTDKPIAIMTCSSSSHHSHSTKPIPIINDTKPDPIVNDTNDTVVIPIPTPEVKPSFLQKNWIWLSAAGLAVIGSVSALFMLNSKKKKTKKK